MLIYTVNDTQLAEIYQFNEQGHTVVVCSSNNGLYVDATITDTIEYQPLWHLFDGQPKLDYQTWAVTPLSVPTWRLRAILAINGKEQDVENAIDQLPEPNKTIAKRAWDYGSNTERDSQTVVFIKGVLGLTDEEVNQYFIDAENIQA